jgi:hypothetical protein
MTTQERELHRILTALLALYIQHAPPTMEAHSVMASAGNLIEALQAGRVRIVKGDGWKE